MEKIMIEAKNLKKTFRVPHEKTTSLKQAALGIFRKKNYTDFNVLKGISFKVQEGEFLGIVGRNGCGKSTLLKILAGIYLINDGELTINGTISPFLELGVGFNPELSGRENVYLNGAILGLSKKEIDEKYDEIVEFSELEEFMDQKLKNYSSGMQVRLAFSVAIHAHAPILLLDEVLAVGDASFQKKCHDVFLKLKKEGRTIVFVTHDMNAVREYCDRAILIADGQIVIDGDPDKVAKKYINYNGEVQLSEIKNLNNEWLLKKVLVNNSEKNINVGYGEPLEIEIDFEKKGTAKDAHIHLAINDENKDTVIFSSSTKEKTYRFDQKTSVKVTLAKELAPGLYFVALSIHNPKNGESYYGNTAITQFRVMKHQEKKGNNQPAIKWA